VTADPSANAVMLGMSGAAYGTACSALILLAAAGGYLAGTRRRPPRHGSVQLRAPKATSTKRAPRRASNPEQSQR
jgi:hypothetical protein